MVAHSLNGFENGGKGIDFTGPTLGRQSAPG